MTDLESTCIDVAEMFCHLKTLDAGSLAFRRQRDAIIEQSLPLADHIARRYWGRGEAHDDLVQAARVGLINAVNRFDVDKGANFLSFAVPTVMGEVRRHFRDYGWAVKVPRRVKEFQGSLKRAREDLSNSLGRSPNASEIAEHLGVDREIVVDTTIALSNYSTLSTDAQVNTGNDDDYRSFTDTLGVVDPGIDRVLQLATVRPLIAALPERQRTLLTLRFFDDMTQSQIADQMGISQMHVSRLLAKALTTLRTQVREPELAAVS